MRNILIVVFFFPIFILSCKHNEFDAEYYAKKYCNCLQKEKESGGDFFDARAKCDGELLMSNHFFRFDYIDYTYGRYLVFLPQKLDDSIADFHSRFFKYVEANCCKIALQGCDKNDTLQRKRKSMDTLYRK